MPAAFATLPAQRHGRVQCALVTRQHAALRGAGNLPQIHSFRPQVPTENDRRILSSTGRETKLPILTSSHALQYVALSRLNASPMQASMRNFMEIHTVAHGHTPLEVRVVCPPSTSVRFNYKMV